MSKLHLRISTAVLFLSCAVLTSRAQSNPDFIISENGHHLSIALDQIGNLHVVWNTFDSLTLSYRKCDSDGIPLSDVKTIHSDLNYRPYLAIGPSHSVAVWYAIEPTSFSPIYGRVLDANGDATSDVMNFSYVGNHPNAAFLSDSTYLVVWGGEGPLSGGFRIYGQIATTGAEMLGNNLLLSDDTTSGQKNLLPKIATHATRDTMAIVWLDRTNSIYKIRIRFFTIDGTPLGPSSIVSDTSAINMWSPQAAMQSDGTVMIAWSATAPDSSGNILVRGFQIDGSPVDSAHKINEILLKHSSELDLGLDLDGKFVVVWEGDVGDKSKLFGQRFLSDGTPYQGNFRVSTTYDSASQIFPSIALRNDTIYVAWTMAYSTGSKVFVRILHFYDQLTFSSPIHNRPPNTFGLSQNYPNPFNPQTTIEYALPQRSQVLLTIFDALGRKIRTLEQNEKQAGNHRVVWDGKDNSGNRVSSGPYYYRLVVNGNAFVTRKLILLK